MQGCSFDGERALCSVLVVDGGLTCFRGLGARVTVPEARKPVLAWGARAGGGRARIDCTCLIVCWCGHVLVWMLVCTSVRVRRCVCVHVSRGAEG